MKYLDNEGILNFFDIPQSQKPYGIFDAVDPKNITHFYPEPEDLYRIHTLIRARKVFNVLEFGLGYSTIVIANALLKNKKDYGGDNPEVRISNPFKVYSVDGSKKWIEHFNISLQKHSKIAHELLNTVNVQYSPCEIGEYNGKICHYYKNIPNVVVDFYYLDGPSGNDVVGQINGISFQNCPERTVMSGDLLKLEPTMLPGTMILVDGRTNNARFLANNFRRNWQHTWSFEDDISCFELVEPPLGKINEAQIRYSLGETYFSRLQQL